MGARLGGTERRKKERQCRRRKSTLEGTGADGPASTAMWVEDVLCRGAEAGGGRAGPRRVSEASLGLVLLLWACVHDGGLRHGSAPPGGGPARLVSQGF